MINLGCVVVQFSPKCHIFFWHKLHTKVMYPGKGKRFIRITSDIWCLPEWLLINQATICCVLTVHHTELRTASAQTTLPHPAICHASTLPKDFSQKPTGEFEGKWCCSHYHWLRFKLACIVSVFCFLGYSHFYYVPTFTAMNHQLICSHGEKMRQVKANRAGSAAHWSQPTLSYSR